MWNTKVHVVQKTLNCKIMDSQTKQRLHDINRRFYSIRAIDFDLTRVDPWRGWERVLARVKSRKDQEAVRVLDAGCGNGRFVEFLIKELQNPIVYLGIDESEALIQLARQRLTSQPSEKVRFLVANLLSQSTIPSGAYELVVAFGLLHHIPELELRRHLVRFLSERVAPGGILVLTHWLFGRDSRFDSHRLSWQRFNEETDEPIDLDSLEEGDHLLSFGDDVGPPRYCHAATEDEIRSLNLATGLELVDTFEADGRDGNLNHYSILLRPT